MKIIFNTERQSLIVPYSESNRIQYEKILNNEIKEIIISDELGEFYEKKVENIRFFAPKQPVITDEHLIIRMLEKNKTPKQIAKALDIDINIVNKFISVPN